MVDRARGPNDWAITPEDFSHHFAYYHRITPPGETLGGERAREFFLQSKLPPQTLSHIWKLADVDKDGRLNAAEFCVAMHLLQRTLKGVPPPPTLPAPLTTCVKLALNPQLPVADEKHMQKCRSAFGAFHENIGKGVLGGDAARYLFKKSNLSKGQLFHIWKLSDLDEDGYLTFHEFAIAMHLIFVAKLGFILPVDLDPTTILPPAFNPILREVQATAEKLPKTEPLRMTLQPFSPPTTPTEVFYSAAPEIFRDGRFKDFPGDPFQMMDEPDSAFVPKPPRKPQPQSPPQQLVRGTLPLPEPARPLPAKETPPLSVPSRETPPLVQAALPLASESPPPPKPKRQSPQLVRRTATPPQAQTKAETPPRRPSSETPPPSQSPKPPTPTLSPPAEKPVVKNSIEVRVVERTEPTLLQAQAVAVVGSRETSPSNEVSSEEDLSEEQGGIDLEELSQASRRFLEESKGKLAEQQRKNLPGGASYHSFGMAEYKSASRKGLSATIEEMQGSVEPPDEPAKPRRQDEGVGKVDLGETSDVIAHLDGLEAEMLTAMDDASGHVSSGEEEAVDMATTRETRTRGSDPVSPPKETGGVSGNRPIRGQDKGDLVSSRQGLGAAVTTKPAPPTARKPPRTAPEPQRREPAPTRQEVPVRRARNNSSYQSYAAKRKSYIEDVVMEDLDQYLQTELDSINDMFQEFQTQDKQSERRIQSESQDLKVMESKAKEDHRLELKQMKALEEKKARESKNLEQEWEEEMARLERERLMEMEKQKDELTVESDAALQNLEQEWQSLLGQGEELVKETQKEKVLRQQREEEERERRERERKEKQDSQEEMTVEEWIGWMEEKKKAGMTPEQQAEYQRRKEAWLAREKAREQKRKREEEERLRKSRERMEQEYQQYRSRERDIKETRLSEAEIQQLQREKNRREEEERKQRVEKHRHSMEITRQREFEELKPKARSSLAARWEEQIKSRSQGPKDKDYRSTVLTGQPGEVSLREEERMQRRLNPSRVDHNGLNGSADKRK